MLYLKRNLDKCEELEFLTQHSTHRDTHNSMWQVEDVELVDQLQAQLRDIRYIFLFMDVILALLDVGGSQGTRSISVGLAEQELFYCAF